MSRFERRQKKKTKNKKPFGNRVRYQSVKQPTNNSSVKNFDVPRVNSKINNTVNNTVITNTVNKPVNTNKEEEEDKSDKINIITILQKHDH